VNDHKPTEITRDDVDKFFNDLMNGEYDVKQRPCFKCGAKHFPNYGWCLDECDECYFSRFPNEEREAFFRSFLE